METGAPIVEDVLRKASTQPVGQEGADHGEPDDQKVEQVVHHIDELVSRIETETETGL